MLTSSTLEFSISITNTPASCWANNSLNNAPWSTSIFSLPSFLEGIKNDWLSINPSISISSFNTAANCVIKVLLGIPSPCNSSISASFKKLIPSRSLPILGLNVASPASVDVLLEITFTAALSKLLASSLGKDLPSSLICLR